MKKAYTSQDRYILNGAARDGVYAVNLKVILKSKVQDNWRNVGVIGYQIGRKREKIRTIILVYKIPGMWEHHVLFPKCGVSQVLIKG